MYNRARTSRQPMARAAYEASRCVDQTCRAEPQATKSRETRTRVGCNHRAGGPQENPSERSVGETWGRKVRNRRSRGRSKSSVSPVDRRRLGPGKATSCHDDGVEAVLAALAESVNHNALPRKKRAPVSSGGCDRGVRGTIAEARGFGRERPHVACTIRRSDVERRETLSSPVSMGGNPSSHARRRVGDAEPGRDGVRVLVV
jgi:hypothetical protein